MRSFLGAAAALALLATQAIAPGPGIYAYAVGTGSYWHSSASGHFDCPLMAISVVEEGVGPVLLLRATGPADDTPGEPLTLERRAMPCALGQTVGFANFTGSPSTGYRAHRTVDHTQLAGVTTETLETSAFTEPPVVVRYRGQTVGGPAPSAWGIDAVLPFAGGL